VHSQLAQAHKCGLILDALGDGRLVELAGDADDPPDEPVVGLAFGQVADELDVDLEQLRRDLLEIAEAGKPGAEVVKRDDASSRTTAGSPIDAPERLNSVASPRAARSTACRITQRSISEISP